MRNALQELQEKLKNMEISILFGEVTYLPPESDGAKTFVIREDNHSEFFEWLNAINYDEGYGRQYLMGRLWVETKDEQIKTLTRGEYDGAEWWGLGDFIPVPLRLINQLAPTWGAFTIKNEREFLVRKRGNEATIYPNGCFKINDLINYELLMAQEL
jgi:hypothetical protein